MKISVIIPAYNCGKYLGKQIECLLNQKVEKEIIVVDNHSTDDTRKVAESYQGVKVVSEETQGASAARNRGLREATGEFIVFADGDDEVEETYLSSLLQAFEERDCMLAVCGYDTYVVENDAKEFIKKSPDEKTYYQWDSMLKRLFQTKYYEGFIWNKMFRRSVIEEHGVSFDEDVFYNEDRLFILRYLLASKGRVSFANTHEYHYMIRKDSAMNNFRQGQRVSEKEITEFLSFERMRQAVKKSGLSEVLYQLEEDMIQSELRCFKRMISKEHIFQYRKSQMRKYARKSLFITYDIQGEFEDVLLHVFRRYGFLGISYTSNPGLFKDIGIL
ncbi:MAG: glycosyltransferase family 2 protein [Lachnospiraceae bacterium]|nr:glycosyltransferase family 2 protein [Lachnospiraceae bacterium]